MKYDESKLVRIKGNHPLRLSIINLAIVKKYREGKFEKDDVLLDIYEIVELVTLEAVEIYKNK